MGLRYLSSDSSGMKNNLKKSLQQGQEVINDLKSGSQHLISAIDGHTLSGAAYTAGKGLFTDLIIPAIDKVSKALDNIQSDLTKYESLEAIVSGESLLDEDRLLVERKIKSVMRDAANNRAENFKQVAKTVEKIPVLDTGTEMFNSLSKQMVSVAKSFQDEIDKIDKKLIKLYKFSTGIQSLFQNSLSNLNSAMQTVVSINSAVVDSKNGNYTVNKSKVENNTVKHSSIFDDIGAGTVSVIEDKAYEQASKSFSSFIENYGDTHILDMSATAKFIKVKNLYSALKKTNVVMQYVNIGMNAESMYKKSGNLYTAGEYAAVSYTLTTVADAISFGTLGAVIQPFINETYKAKKSWNQQYNEALNVRHEMQKKYEVNESFSDKIFENVNNPNLAH